MSKGFIGIRVRHPIQNLNYLFEEIFVIHVSVASLFPLLRSIRYREEVWNNKCISRESKGIVGLWTLKIQINMCVSSTHEDFCKI